MTLLAIKKEDRKLVKVSLTWAQGDCSAQCCGQVLAQGADINGITFTQIVAQVECVNGSAERLQGNANSGHVDLKSGSLADEMSMQTMQAQK